eukprot:5635143-Pyramimonas_sp.AAC.1
MTRRGYLRRQRRGSLKPGPKRSLPAAPPEGRAGAGLPALAFSCSDVASSTMRSSSVSKSSSLSSSTAISSPCAGLAREKKIASCSLASMGES